MQILKLNSVQQNNTILLCTVYSSELINVDNIVRIEAMSSYSKIYFSNGKSLVVAKVLRWFEEKLSATKFIRIHRTHFVNKSFMQQYSNAGKVKLLSGEYIDVSRRRKKHFLQQWRAAS